MNDTSIRVKKTTLEQLKLLKEVGKYKSVDALLQGLIMIFKPNEQVRD